MRRLAVLLLLGMAACAGNQDLIVAQKHGAMITAVAAGSPAEQAGILPGDKLVYVIIWPHQNVVMDGRHAEALLEAAFNDYGKALIAVHRDGRMRAFQIVFNKTPVSGLEFAGSP